MRARAAMGLTFASVMWGAACRNDVVVVPQVDEPLPAIQSSMVEKRRDCPSHSAVTLFSSGEDSTLYTELSVPKEITLVPEFHDCQRLLIDRATTYGPLVGVFASNTLGVSGSTGSRLPVAEVVNFDVVEYTPLGIKPQFNCLYMFRDSAAANGIAAYMVSVGRVEKACLNEYAPSMSGTPLLVIPHTPPPPLNWEDIPAVARWDWDPVTRRQYIGIRCDLQWCEVGPQDGFGLSTAHTYPFAHKREQRTFWIKGWYDEQQLAAKSGNSLWPLPAVGTVVPDSSLGDYSDATFPTSRWVPAARVAIRPYRTEYMSKLGLGPAVIPHRMNKLELCKAPWTTCAASAGGSPAQPTVNCTGTANDWWARMITPTGQTKYFCVVRTAHTHAIEGTARWRWLLEDETIWVRCAEGCCQVNSDFQ